MNYLDIIILALLIIGIVFGVRRGLIVSILNIVGLGVTFILCFILMEPVSSLIVENTSLPDYINSLVSKRINSLDSMTSMIVDKLKVSGMSPNEFLTTSFINIATFIILFLIITIAISFIKGGVGKTVKNSPLGPIDSLLGGVLGFFKWIIILMLIFAFLTPIMPLLNDNNEFYTLISESYIAKNFIDYNIITTLINSFMSSDIKGLVSF